MDLRQIADDIPAYDAFLTVDELEASSHHLVQEYPDRASLRTVGQTRRGDPINLLTIHGGPQQAFVFGGPHPNEPIGTMTIEYLSRRLCQDEALRDELGYTWHFIKSIDSDGMRLNEGWFKGPFTPTNYARHFFRPAPFDQVEWTFPMHYKDHHFDQPLPETRALMQVIDEVQPKLLYSLHNAGFGGVYYYVSDPCQPLYPTFHQIPEWFNLALDLGEPEVPFAQTYAPAVYKMLTARDTYDYMEQNGIENPADEMMSGASSYEYASKYGSFFLVVEMPYYDDPRVNDQTVTDTLRRDAILQNLDSQEEFDGWITAQMDRLTFKTETPITRAVMAFLKSGKAGREAQRQWAQTATETDRPATQAELFSSLLTARFYRLLLLGMYRRIAEAEDIEELMQQANARFETQAAELESALNYRVIPIRSLVGVQACAGLATAAHVTTL